MDEHDEQDRYVAQLQEVFNSCDPNGSGYLDRHGITLLCQRLQLDEQTPFFLQHLLGEKSQSLVSFTEFKDEFISLLTQSIEQIDPIQNQKLVASPEREISPKYVRGNKKYGRRSQPESQESDDFDPDNPTGLSDSEVVCNGNRSVEPSHDETFRNEIDVMDHDGYPYTSSQVNNSKVFVKRKRRSRSDSESYLSSPKLYDHFSDHISPSHVGNEAEYLRNIWKKLSVGNDGYLDLSELERVCKHIGMENFSQEVVSQLFVKLDTDQDGKISFEEFLHVFQNGETHSYHITAGNTFKDERCETSVGTAEAKMFSSLDPENTGFVEHNAIIDLWESLGFTNGCKVLKELGFKSSKCVNLQDLSVALEEALSGEETQLHQVAVASVLYELRFLKNCLEQLKIERNKLRADVSEANTRATLLAQEIDDQNAKLEKNSQSKIAMLDKKYKEQIQDLTEQHHHEKEQLNAQLLKVHQRVDNELKMLREEQNCLQEKLEACRKENQRFENENQELSEKLMETERVIECQQKDLSSLLQLRQKLEELESGDNLHEYKYHSVLTELESLKLENQKLRDCNDELVLKVESLQQQMLSKPPSRGPSHKRNGSWLGEYVQNSAVKRKGDGTENNVEASSNCTPRLGKVRCKSPELCEEIFINEMGKEKLDIYLNHDEQDSFEEDLSDEKVSPSYDFSNESRILNPVPPTMEMKQVFQFLKDKMQEEYMNEREEMILQNLRNAEMKNLSLENEMEQLRLLHENELKQQQQFNADMRNWKMKYIELQEVVDKISYHSPKENKLTLTDIKSYKDVAVNVALMCDNAFDNVEIETAKHKPQPKSDSNELPKKLEETMRRERHVLESHAEIQQKYTEHEQQSQLEASLTEISTLPYIELAGGDTFSSEEIDVLSQSHLSTHSDTVVHFDSDCLVGDKLPENELQTLPVLLSELNNIKRAYVSLQETFKMTEENYLSTKALLEKCQVEKDKDMKSFKQKNLELELRCSELEDDIKLLKKINSETDHRHLFENERTTCDDLSRLEEKLVVLQEEHLQQVEEIESYWRSQIDTLKRSQEMEVVQARAKCVQLEAKLNEVIESSLPSFSVECNYATTATNTENYELENINFLTSGPGVVCVGSSNDSRIFSDKSLLEKECEELRKRKTELEEEISILELEWATLEGVLPSHNASAESCLKENGNPESQMVLSTTSDNNQQFACEQDTHHFAVQESDTSKSDRINELGHQLKHLDKKCTYLLNHNKKTEKLFKATKDQHKIEIDNLKQMLQNAQTMMKQQTDEYESQIEKADSLVKKLYVENAQLMKALQVTEERQKKAEQLNANLHDKCTALTQLVADIYHTAIA